MKPRDNCIYCGTLLLQDPWNAHWAHCPHCSPTHWHNAAKQWRQWEMEAYAKWAAADPKGRPTRNGEKE